MREFDISLYLVTNSDEMDRDEFLRRVEAALKGGVTLVQLREKDMSGREFYYLAKSLHQITSAYHVPLLIDDRLDIALAIGAEGVHIGQSDIPVHIARKILGDEMIIGATAKTVEQAIEAERDGADYLGIGAIHPTTTKVKTQLTSVDTLNEIADSISIPIVAIGGLKRNNLEVLKGSGASGVAVVSAIMNADDPEESSVELLNKLKELNII